MSLRGFTLVAFLAALALPPGLAAARPADPDAHRRIPTAMQNSTDRDGARRATPLAGYASTDTVTYGGTVWAADSNRWEALRGTPGNPARWTFDSGVGSNFTEPTPEPKPAGWHHRMEGWTGVDRTFNPLPYYRRSTTCALNGAYSMYAGVTTSEANALCYAAGQGYGNRWNLVVSKTFNYPGSGNVQLSFVYRTECEPNFDYLYVNVDTTGNGSQDVVNLVDYTGNLGPSATVFTLIPGVTMRMNAGPVSIQFNATSDGAYSDEDGSYPTTCGHSSVDDVRLTGAITDFSDFEAGPNGWTLLPITSGPGGDFSDIRALASMSPFPSFCPCAMADSVLVFGDTGGGHSTPVDNFVASPWIDLKAGGDVGKPGKVLIYHAATDLPLLNYIFTYTLASWYPALCPTTGLVHTQPFTDNLFGVIYYFQGPPSCTVPGSPYREDMSLLIPPSAEQVRVGIAVVSYCDMWANCTGVSNSTPWFDDVSFGVFGATNAPVVSQSTLDVFQDNFSADGTLNPAATGRIDVNTIKGAPAPAAGTALGDTLVVRGDGGNQEVRVVFHVRPGPFTSASALAAWAASKWTPEAGIGPGWYSARCDTAEQGGSQGYSSWMGALHESDPKFGGGTDTDTGGDGDTGQLSHDIFPDHLLTPGARIDYFVTSRFLPPDPRNPGGTFWYVTPDTTGGNYREMEILPSSMAADTTWNCVLYVDHHADRDFGAQRLEEQGLTAALGTGGANAEGTLFDRYDVQAPSSNQASLGRPPGTAYGATGRQLSAYRVVAWHSASEASFNLSGYDADLLGGWIQELGNPGRRFWASGDGFVKGIASEGVPSAQAFLSTLCGVQFTCDTIRLATCPTGSVFDSTYCLPLGPAAAAAFASAMPVSARGNGCPDVRSFDLLGANPGVASAQGQLDYVKSDGAHHFASVTNSNSIDVNYRTVVDGVGVGALRDPHGNPHNPALCDITTPAVARAVDVLAWFASPGYGTVCGPLPVSDADPGDGAPRPPAWRTQLGSIYPNPMNPTTRIAYTLGRADERARLAVFDVTGRLIRTLLDDRVAAGPHEVTWDGRDDAGRGVGSGLYFVRLVTRDRVESKKLVVSK